MLFLKKLYTLVVLHGCLGYTDMSQPLSDCAQSHPANLTPPPPLSTLTGSIIISILLYSGKLVILIHMCDLLISVSLFTKC